MLETGLSMALIVLVMANVRRSHLNSYKIDELRDELDEMINGNGEGIPGLKKEIKEEVQACIGGCDDE